MKNNSFFLIIVSLVFAVCRMSAQTFGAPKTFHPGELQTKYYDGTIGANSNNYSAAGSFCNYAYFESGFASYGGRDIILSSKGSASLYGFSVRAGGKGDDEALAMRQMGTNFIMCGYFSDTATFGSTTVISKGGRDIFVCSYTNSGTFNWVRAYGSTGDDWATYVTNGNPSSQIVISINYSDTLVAGTDTLLCSGATDAGYIRLSSSGTLVEARKLYGGPGEDRVNQLWWSVNIMTTGCFSDSMIVGNDTVYSNGSTDFIALATSSSTGPVWSYVNGGAGKDDGGEFILQSGNLQMVGVFEQSWSEGSSTFTSNGMQDCFYFSINQTTGLPVNGFSYGGPGKDTVTSIYWDNVISLLTFAGSFEQTMVLDMVTLVSTGMTDAYLVQTDIYGLFNSGQRYGSTGDDCFLGATYNSGNLEFIAWGYLALGNYPYPANYPYPIEHYGVVRKYNSSYNFLTSTTSAYGGAAAMAVDADSYGNHYVTFHYGGWLDLDTLQLTGTGGHTVTAKYDPAGNLLWSRSSIDVADNGQTTTPYSGGDFIQVSPTGYSYVVGYLRSKATFGSTVLTPQYENSTPAGGAGDVFMVCYDPGGNVVFAKRIASNTNGVIVEGLTMNNNIQLTVSGHWGSGNLTLESGSLTGLNSTRQGFILRYSPAGLLGASIRIASTNAVVYTDQTALDNSNNIYALLYFRGSVLSDLSLTSNDVTSYNTVLVKYTPAGVPVWTQNIQRTASSFNKYGGIIFDSLAGLYVSAPFINPITLPNGDVLNDISPNGYDSWIARVDLAGNFIWSNHMAVSGANSSFYVEGMTSNNRGTGIISFTHSDSLAIGVNQIPDNTGSRKSLYSFDMQANMVNLYTEPERGLSDLFVDRSPDGIITISGEVYNPFSTCATDTMFSGQTNNELFYLTYLDTCMIAQFSYSESGGIYQFTDNTINPDSVYWDFGDGNFSTASNPTHMYSSTGTFTVTMVAWTNCGPDTTTTIVTWNPLQVNSGENIPAVSVYPNPTNSAVTISADAPISNIHVYTAHGQLVKVAQGENKFSHILSLDEFAEGMFIIRIDFADGKSSVSRIYKTE